MIITNFDLQNQPLERGVVSQPLALPHGSLHEAGTPHTRPIPLLHSPTPSFLPSSSFFFNLKAEMIQGKGIPGEA